MQAHNAVASALLHRQHLITRTGVLLIQLVHGSPPRLATKTYTGQDPFLNIFWESFSSSCDIVRVSRDFFIYIG